GPGGYGLTPVNVDDVAQIGIDAAMGEANPSAPRASPTGSKRGTLGRLAVQQRPHTETPRRTPTCA
ncbi:MAG: hypothetical protein OEO77_09485, partial [Acidimicrobiia bacterium]|nr:hypothetical protein [Acidimicrobiia bacterium]